MSLRFYVDSEALTIVKKSLQETFSLITPHQKTIILKVENIEKKIINAKSALVFNKACVEENLLSNFTNIMRDRAVQQRQYTLDFKVNLLKDEIL